MNGSGARQSNIRERRPQTGRSPNAPAMRRQKEGMEDKIFFEQDRIRTNADESSREVSRTGAAINHEAIDIGSNKPVVLQLVPLASIDPATLEQFKERARSVQKLDHVNIAKLF